LLTRALPSLSLSVPPRPRPLSPSHSLSFSRPRASPPLPARPTARSGCPAPTRRPTSTAPTPPTTALT